MDLPIGQVCAKTAYSSRKRARRAIRRLHPGDQLRAYRCRRCGWFHAGHNPPEVTSGLMTAWEYYARWTGPTTREVTNP